ncbi:NADPH:adrenodoxin oxidoreductase mitochondrial precursor [Byssothecium circinans]|uniref:NADPH:adrenodoxin oxidoreductase, mitochondrial n=1 Tax=Byssothecium circinans TaxID=147558 RepID=A0A6A5TJ04_9PLEO|nr:NADPH:adrenodoxin oxidoreductase mitochondrial precursor [Byssothecium circinans]
MTKSSYSMQNVKHLAGTPYVCARCTKHIATTYPRPIRAYSSYQPARRLAINNASRRTSTAQTSFPDLQRHAFTTTGSKKPLRLAVIGSGPAGFYTAHRLMKKVPHVVVDMYEQLPVPYGLVRFGVAPDHPEVKNCENTFEDVAASPRFNYIGNVKIGRDVELSEMKPHYDAILFSYGASEDRKLGIPGEDLPGVCSAREFVGWYNGLPQFQGLNPDLQAGDQVVIVGQGNVALDVARILLTPVDALRKTDISSEALETLSQSKVKSVKVVGRRGPLQAAFTIKEARELMHIPGVAFEPIDRSLYPPDIKKLPRVSRRITEVLIKGTQQVENATKSWALDFLKAPKSMNADGTTGRLASVAFTNQAFAPGTDIYSKSASVVPIEETTFYPASLAFRSVGYKSAALPGLASIGAPFDNKLGIIPNDPFGRILTPSGAPGDLAAGHVPGLYCAGWVKRGPTGVIASTMEDAFTSADVIAQDWESEVPFLNSENGESHSTGLGWDGLKQEVVGRGVRPVSWQDWKRIDQAERKKGKALGKEREKFLSVEDMMGVLDS